MRSGADAASIICQSSYFTLVWEGSWRIDVAVDDLRVAKGTLNWLHALQERKSPVVPLDVTIRDRDPLIIKGILTVMADTEGLHRVVFGYRTPVASALRLLATGSLVEDSTQVPFPELMEMWIEEPIQDDDWEYLVGMLRRRQGEIDVRDGVQTLKPLRKVRLGGNLHPESESLEISAFSRFYWPNRVEKVRRLLGPEGELIWYGRFVTEDGAFDDRPAPSEWN
ncbi:hypothetical protein M407DRAFT_20920 [Tulasnella calospora MUT 4182]|uniref:Uncharacterized protein n=1 Tax=Tulasnella calospora MUT 4182 TaxID=1051891 RepID=A0A0C3QQX8_9AGAM|nr:hypothetical protein M407DRAFT_20920 [Tulasnella calospora MUT 4182]